MKHYFGEDYINSELNAFGIEPTEEKSFVTRPLFKNMAFEAGGKLLYIDRNHNNSVDKKDLIFEILLGMQWGFL